MPTMMQIKQSAFYNAINWKYTLLLTIMAGCLFFVGFDIHALDAADGTSSAVHAGLSLLWGIPFVGILLSIALFPIFAEDFWHKHFGKISAFWALSFLLPYIAHAGVGHTWHELLHVALFEYIPFIALLFALYVASGGIRIEGHLRGCPSLNTGILIIGTVLASIMGTTGAAMLLIRPLLEANEWRKHKTHIVVFFIFLVANIGGSLTPLGDPPLFLGFLKGVSFFWPGQFMFLPMLIVSVVLLLLFYVVDSYYFKLEDGEHHKDNVPISFRISGYQNLFLVVMVVLLVLQSGVWVTSPVIHLGHGLDLKLCNIIRDLGLFAIGILSLWITNNDIRERNHFEWFPILEVAKLFAGIFITIIPVIAILKLGDAGDLAAITSLVSNADGTPNNLLYFWVTGILSSFLDNAPTYLVFFNMAGGDAQLLMGQLSNTLLAISAGAVFMGANTYIGNAPNFMVRAIAVRRNVNMPSFFGYIVWSSLILLPIYFVISLIFFL